MTVAHMQRAKAKDGWLKATRVPPAPEVQ